MKATKFLVLILVLVLLVTLSGATDAQEPQASGDEGTSPATVLNDGCVAGSEYDPNCDVDHDGDSDVVDIQLTASHWGHTGTYSAPYWSLTGNAGTDPSTDFLGTTDGKNLVINPNGGNVGIGTTSPNSKLEVAGTIHSTSGGLKFPDGTIQTTAPVRIDFRANAGTPFTEVLNLGGLILQARCFWGMDYELEVNASTTINDSTIHVTYTFGSSLYGGPTNEGVFDEDFDTGESLDLFNVGIHGYYDVQGMLVYSSPAGSHVTVLFQAHDTRGGTTPLGGTTACLFGGTAFYSPSP